MSRKHRRSRRRYGARKVRSLRPEARVEPLEQRLLLSTVLDVAGVDTFTFTDPQGDIVTIDVAGTTGTATVTGDDTVVANGGDLDDGEAIVGIDIAGASADFTITFAVDSTTNVLNPTDGNVFLGEVTSDAAILGLYCVPDLTGGATPASQFELASFAGTTFSAGGGLNVDQISGDRAGLALALTQGLPAGASVNVIGSLTGDVTIAQVYAGTINVDGDVGPGQWVLPSVDTSGYLGLANGVFYADVMVNGPFRGIATISDDVMGYWDIVGNVARSGRLQAGHWEYVTVTGAFNGLLIAVDGGGGGQGGSVTLDVFGSLNPSARVISNSDLDLNVTGDVLPGAEAAAAGQLSGTVGGDFSGHYVCSSTMILDITGMMPGGVLQASYDITLTVGGKVSDSRIEGGELSVDLAGVLKDSSLFGTTDIILDVGASMLRSSVATAEAFTVDIHGNGTDCLLEGSESDSTLTVGGDFINGYATGGSSSLSVDVGGKVLNSTFTAPESAVSVTTGGPMNDSEVFACTDAILDIGGPLRRSTVTAGYDLSLTTGGPVVDSTLLAFSTASVYVTGDMVRSSVYAAYSSLTLDVTGSMLDSTAGAAYYSATVTIGGDMLRSTVFVNTYAVTLDVGGRMEDSSVLAESDVTLTVGAGMTRSTVSSAEGDVELTIAESMVDSEAFASGTMTAVIGGALNNSTLTMDYDGTVTIGGTMASSVQAMSGDLTLTVGGAMKVGSAIFAADDLIADLRSIHGTVQADRLDLEVAGNVGELGSVQANHVLDLSAVPDNKAFHVGGDFNGRLDVTTSFDTGTGATATLIDGSVGERGKFNITGTFQTALGPPPAAAEVVFGGAFLGEFCLLTDLGVDLTFAGDANRVIIGGAANGTITSGGQLDFLSTGSLFTPTGATTGDFADGVGTAAGNLVTATGYGRVTPSTVVVDAAGAAPFSQLDLSAATLAPDNAVWTDPEGDIVTIRLEGTSGKAVFVSDESVAANNRLDDGESIVSIDITGASPDFAISFSVDSTTNVANPTDGHVFLGAVQSDAEILGLYTVADTTGGATPASQFELFAFGGPGFAMNGGLNVDDISGAVVLDGWVRWGRVINARDDFGGNLVVNGNFNGTVNVGGDAGSDGGAWVISGNVGRSGFVGGVGGDFDANLVVRGDWAGMATIDGDVNGDWLIRGNAWKGGRLLAEGWEGVRVWSNFRSALAGHEDGDEITASIGGHLIQMGRVTSAGELVLDVSGSVVNGALAASYESMTAAIGGNLSQARMMSMSQATVDIAGSMLNGRLDAYYNVTVTIAGDMQDSKISCSGATLDVAGEMTRSVLFAGYSEITAHVGGDMQLSDMLYTGGDGTIDIAGDMLDSSILAGYGDLVVRVAGDVDPSLIVNGYSSLTAHIGGSVVDSVIASLYYEATIAIGGDVIRSTLQGASCLTADIGGDVTGSFLVSPSSEVSAFIGGSMTDSRIDSASEVTASIGGDLVRSTVFGDESDVSLFVSGDMVDSWVGSGTYSVTAVIGGDMVRSKIYAAEYGVDVTIGGQMTQSQVASYSTATLVVGGDMVDSSLYNVWYDQTLTVGGDMIRSDAVASTSGVTANIGGDFQDSSIFGSDDHSVVIGGSLGSSVISYDGDVTLTVGGEVLAGSAVTAAAELYGRLNVTSGTMMNGALNACYMEVRIGGTVGGPATIQVAHTVSDFLVAGDFGGRLDVRDFSGDGAVTVRGDVLQGAKFNAIESDMAFVFGGDFLGEFILCSGLEADLVGGGAFTSAVIAGPVEAGVFVDGALNFLSSGSLFDPTIPGVAGAFLDGMGTLTGYLVAGGGYTSVIPLL